MNGIKTIPQEREARMRIISEGRVYDTEDAIKIGSSVQMRELFHDNYSRGVGEPMGEMIDVAYIVSTLYRAQHGEFFILLEKFTFGNHRSGISEEDARSRKERLFNFTMSEEANAIPDDVPVEGRYHATISILADGKFPTTGKEWAKGHLTAFDYFMAKNRGLFDDEDGAQVAFTVRVPARLKDKLEAEASRNGTSQAKMISRLIDEYEAPVQEGR